MKKSIVIALSLFCMIMASAQTKKITGTLTEEGGVPLPGVSVTVANQNIGTSTDFDGVYEISASEGDSLVFSYIGFITETVIVKKANVINVELQLNSEELEEVVVVGYAVQTHRSITASVSNVGVMDRHKSTKADIQRHLQGRTAGVQITNTANLSKEDKLILKNAMKQNQQAELLYIVDGKPIPQANNTIIENMNPHHIQKKHIYNAARSQRTFGISGKKGCIVITTKRGNYSVEDDERYATINENKFEQALLSPLSTFSIDVDKASYSNIRRMINNGQSVKSGAVKIEEMVNYFNYDYAQPSSEHPFAIHTEVAQTPWDSTTKLVRIGLQGKIYQNEVLPASNLTFLIDVSGSMSNENKLPLLKKAFKLLVNQLREKDKVAIVVYAGAAGVVLKSTSGANKEAILDALDNLEAGGSTAGGEGIELAYKIAQKNFKRNGNNRVILATDGDFNVGSSSDIAMEKLIKEKRKSGVYLSVLGFGMGNYQDSKLETLADKGNGNHAYIDSMQEAQKVFVNEFGGTLYTIAKDVKIQVEFNPSQVQSYRLIGYENRMLETEDFVDDTKDAGELGSGHTVTALYEIIPVGVTHNYSLDHIPLKYTDVLAIKAFSNELLSVKFRYKKPNGNTSIEMVKEVENTAKELSDDFNFASAVALFGMQLRNSKFDNNATIENVLALAERGRGDDKNGYRAEFIRLVKTYGNSL